MCVEFNYHYMLVVSSFHNLSSYKHLIHKLKFNIFFYWSQTKLAHFLRAYFILQMPVLFKIKHATMIKETMAVHISFELRNQV